MISQKSSSHWRTHAYSARLRYNGIGSLLGTCISVVFLVVFSYVFHFSAFFIYFPLLIFAGITIFGTFRFMREVSEEDINPSESATSSNHEISHPNASFQLLAGISILCVVYFLIGINLSIAKPFTQLLVYEKITHDQLLIFLIFIPSSFIAMIVAPKLAETSNHINPYLAIIIICFAGALATILLLLTSSGIVFTLVLLVDSAIAYTGGVILKRYLSQSSQQHNLGKIFGLVNVMPVLGMIIGPIFGGYLRDAFGSTFPFVISIVVELILIIPYLGAIRLLSSRILPSPPNVVLVNSND